MIVGLEGLVAHKEPSCIHLNVHGIVYEVFVSLHTFSDIKDEKTFLHIAHIIREDAQNLYGFSEKSEKILFDGMLKINGIGPKAALAICSTFTPEQFASIISMKDVNALKKVPGIGPKSAGRIMVELAGFDEVLLNTNSPKTTSMTEASMALEMLGFKKEHIVQALNGLTSTETSSLVKEALKKLQKI